MEFNTLTKRLAERYGWTVDDFEASAALAADDAARTNGGKRWCLSSPCRLRWRRLIPTLIFALPKADQLAALIARAYETGIVAIDTETDGLDAMQCRLVGVSLAVAPGEAAYMPLAHGAGDGLALEDETPPQIDERLALDMLKPLLADPSVKKILQNAKFDTQILARYGLTLSTPMKTPC